MIIPVGIDHVIRGWPRITLAIIATCTVVQIYSAELAPSAEDVQRHITAKVAELPPDADEAAQQQAADEIERFANKLPSYRFGYRNDSGVSYRLVTCAFVHTGWLHLIGNMLFLWLAGAALENAAPSRPPPPARSSPAPQPQAPVATAVEPPVDSRVGSRVLR